MRDFHRRLRWLEGGSSAGVEPQLIKISGGLPGSPLCASIGRDRRIYPRPGESESEFTSRSLDLAIELDEGFVVVGTLLPEDDHDWPVDEC